MFLDRRVQAARGSVDSSGPIGFAALLFLSLFVSVCFLLLSLMERAAERKRDRTRLSQNVSGDGG